MSSAQQLRDGVRKAYSAAAENPQGEHPFPVGRRFAESLGYRKKLLASLPSTSVDAFSGVCNAAISADLPAGITILDLGCGAGLDSLIAARRVGPKGRVIGVDFSDAMLARARQSTVEVRASNLEFQKESVENLSLEDGQRRHLSRASTSSTTGRRSLRGRTHTARAPRFEGAGERSQLVRLNRRSQGRRRLPTGVSSGWIPRSRDSANNS